MFSNLTETNPGFLQIGTKGSTMSSMAYITTILVSTIGFLMWPHLFSKSYATKARTIKKTMLVYPVFALFLIPLLFVGFSAANVIDTSQIGSPDEILPYLITTVLSLPGWVYGLVCAGALAAAMSTADAITHSASLEFTDGFVRSIKKDLSSKSTLLIMRIGVFVIGGLAYFITVFGGQGLIALLLGAYGSIVKFAPGVYAALYSTRVTGPAVITGLIAGTFVNYYYQLVAESQQLDINPGILGLIVNVALVFVISAFSQVKEVPMAEEYRKIGS